LGKLPISSGDIPQILEETISPTGTAAIAASRMQSIRGKREKTPGKRKLAFSPGVFSFFMCP